MMLFALVCALLLEQLQPPPADNAVWRMHQRLADWALDHLDAGSPVHGWITWSVAVLLPALASMLIYHLLRWLAWPLALPWLVGLLYVSLGFRQFSHAISAISNALETGDFAQARALLAQWQGSSTKAIPADALTAQVLEHAVMDAHRHVFGVLAAYVLCSAVGLGPAGAVLYMGAQRVLARWHTQATETGHGGQAVRAARQAWAAINWLPVRITAAGFAAVGNFEQAVENWRQQQDGWLPQRPATDEADHEIDHEAALLQAVAAGAINLAGGFGWVPQAAPAANAQAPHPNAATGPTANATLHAPFAMVPAPGSHTPDPTLFDSDPQPALRPVLVEEPLGPHHLSLFARLVWRAVVLWLALITLVTFTHWLS